MEVWDILDEQGNITGETMCKGDKKVREKGIYHPGADVWIVNSQKEILIQKRSPEKNFSTKCMGNDRRFYNKRRNSIRNVKKRNNGRIRSKIRC